MKKLSPVTIMASLPLFSSPAVQSRASHVFCDDNLLIKQFTQSVHRRRYSVSDSELASLHVITPLFFYDTFYDTIDSWFSEEEWESSLLQPSHLHLARTKRCSISSDRLMIPNLKSTISFSSSAHLLLHITMHCQKLKMIDN